MKRETRIGLGAETWRKETTVTT